MKEIIAALIEWVQANKACIDYYNSTHENLFDEEVYNKLVEKEIETRNILYNLVPKY